MAETDLIFSQLYEFAVGVGLGGGLGFFYACYRLQFHSGNYSRRQLLASDSLWWLFAAIVTVGALIFLKWGALRWLFFLWWFLGFLLSYLFLWQPLCRKLKSIFADKPKPPIHFQKGQGVFSRQNGKDSPLKEESLLSKPFDAAAKGIYQGYALGRKHYAAARKKQQEATAKWKKQITAEKKKLKQKVQTALWPEPKQAEVDDVLEEAEIDSLDGAEKNK